MDNIGSLAIVLIILVAIVIQILKDTIKRDEEKRRQAEIFWQEYEK